MSQNSSIAVDTDEDVNDENSSIRNIDLHSKISGVRWENGRTYHTYRDGEYWGPNDKAMLDHENIVHNLCLLSMNDQLYLSPIQNPQQILDIGTGHGLWALGMADKFPDAKVYGIDLSPRPPHEAPPHNVEFITDDATASIWTYPAEHFDFIHIRGLYGSISDWPALYANVMHHLKPGGWIEHMEWSVHLRSPDGSLTQNPTLTTWSRVGLEHGQRTGKSVTIAEDMQGLIGDAGFVNVKHRRYRWPIGTWCKNLSMKKIGRFNQTNWTEGVEGWAMAVYTRELHWDADRVREWCRTVRSVVEDRSVRVYHDVPVVYAQKPFQ